MRCLTVLIELSGVILRAGFRIVFLGESWEARATLDRIRIKYRGIAKENAGASRSRLIIIHPAENMRR